MDLISKKTISSSERDFSRAEKKSSFFVIASAAILLVVFLIWGGIFLYKLNLKKSIEKIREETQSLEESRNKELENEMISFDSQLRDAEKILANHLYWTEFFSKLEASTLNQAVYMSFSADSSGKANLAVKTTSYTNVAKQMASLSGEPWVDKINVSNVSIGTGGVNFRLSIDFIKDKILLKKKNGEI